MPKLKLPNFNEVMNMSVKQLNRAFDKLMPRALAKAEKIEKAGKGDYIKNNLKAIYNASTLQEQVIEASQLLRSQFSDLNKINDFEAKMINTLNDHGYDGINEHNIGDFNKFMQRMRDRYNGRKIPDSVRVVKSWLEAQRLKVSNKALIDNMSFFKQNLDKLEKVPTSRNKSTYSFKAVQNRIKKYNK